MSKADSKIRRQYTDDRDEDKAKYQYTDTQNKARCCQLGISAKTNRTSIDHRRLGEREKNDFFTAGAKSDKPPVVGHGVTKPEVFIFDVIVIIAQLHTTP